MVMAKTLGKIIQRIFTVCLAGPVLLFLSSSVMAEETSASSPLKLEEIKVHKTNQSPLLGPNQSRLKRTTGVIREPLRPFEENPCETCHQSRELPNWRNSVHGINGVACFNCHKPHGENDPVPASSEKMEPCQRCHKKQNFLHDSVACVACHKIHAEKDPMTIKSAQTEHCGRCHQEQRLALNRPSHHPIQSGQMGCNDCHRPHDADGGKLLVGDDVNETCYRCHGEKRGPYLWEHEPVTENCTVCHLPHGSNQPFLLVQRAPLLCQMCHNPSGHTAPHINTAYDSDSLLDGSPSEFLLGRSCVNCHPQIHGSNHPSGSKLQR